MTLKHSIYDFASMLGELGLVSSSSLDNGGDVPVGYISYDSHNVKTNTLFVCKGAHLKDEYLKTALENGAVGYVAERVHDDVSGVPYIIVSDMRKTLAAMADYYYGSPWKKLVLTGVTGTKGKSSVTFFLKQILDEYEKAVGGRETAVVSGISNYDGRVREEARRTTPEAFELWTHFNNAVESGIEFLTMEVSSQALKYNRTAGIIFEAGVLMNIGEDHISPIEHPTIEDYIESKMKIFAQSRTAFINADSKYAALALAKAAESPVTEKIVTFGENEGADYHAYDIVSARDGVAFRVRCRSFNESFKLGLPGTFNVSNALAAMAVACSYGIPTEFIKSGLKNARVPGRMEVFTNKKKDLAVIVDYAHNQLSFKALFDSTAKEYPGWTINIVFGCPGVKALGRRKTLAEIAGKCAAVSYITEEDEGEEPLSKISEEVAANVEAAGGKCIIINDREKAVRRAILDAEPNTVILITGKGRETRMKRGMKYIDTPSDVDYTEKFIAEKDSLAAK